MDLTGPATAPAVDLTEPRSSRPRPTVLVVDDEEDVRGMLRVALGLKGWAVAEATGRDAMAAFDSVRPDVVILDQRMPEVTGIEIARLLRARPWTGRMLLFTAFVDVPVSEIQALDLIPVSKVNVVGLHQVMDELQKELARVIDLTEAPAETDRG